MKDRPIIFSGDMVRALLEERKTQTRRVIKPQPHGVVDADAILAGFLDPVPVEGGVEHVSRNCPYGRPGDRLWVRETWAPARASASYEYPGDVCYFQWTTEECGPLRPDAPELSLHYRADGEDGNPAEFYMPHGNEIGWRSPRYMPRWASRITLEVTGVRIERVQDISADDARAEGFTGHDPEPEDEGGTIYAWPGRSSAPCPRAHFVTIWDRINGKRDGCAWADNPWVWAVDLRLAEVRP